MHFNRQPTGLRHEGSRDHSGERADGAALLIITISKHMDKPARLILV